VGMGDWSRAVNSRIECRSWVLGVALLLAIFLACEAKDEGPTGPGTFATGDPVVEPASGAILADGRDSTEVAAYVFSEEGNPLRGIAVRFRTDFGMITPMAVTDAAGRVSAILKSEYSSIDRTIRVCAEIPERADSTSISTGKEGLLASRVPPPAGACLVWFGPSDGAPAKNRLALVAAGTAERTACADIALLGVTVSVDAGPGSLPADGVSVSTLRAVLRETVRGVPVERAALSFSTSAGNVEAEKVTDGEGIALASLTSSTSPDTAVVGVYLDLVKVAETAVPFRAVRMDLAASPPSIPADGESEGGVIATLLSEENRPLAGLAIRFETDRGSILSPVITGDDGRAVALITSAPEPGNAMVIARFAGALIETIFVSFGTEFLPAEIFLAADPVEIVADGLSGAALSATLLDSTGNAVPDGTPVLFEILSGGGLLPGASSTAGGVAEAALTSGTIVSTATIRASTGDLSDTITVRYVPGDPAALLLAADPAGVLANGQEISAIAATAKDLFGNRVKRGTEVTFEAERGVIGERALTDSNGVAAVIYTAAFGAGVDRITATAGDAVGQITIDLFADDPTAVLLDSLSRDAVHVQGTGYTEAATMVFRVYDANGVPVGPGYPVDFELVATTDGGGEFLYPVSDTTDSRGRVRTTLNAGTRPGVTESVARIASLFIESQVVPVAIHGFLPDPDHLEIAADTLNIPGLCYAGWEDSVFAWVYDRFSNPVAGGTAVYFSSGYCGIAGSDTTDERGRARAIFTSTEPYPPDGYVTITAQTADSLGSRISHETTILLSGCTGPITVDPDTFFIDDGDYEQFGYTVSDVYGRPLSAGTAITVTSTGGILGGDISVILPDVLAGYTDFSFFLGDATPGDGQPAVPVFVTIEVASKNGNAYTSIAGKID